MEKSQDFATSWCTYVIPKFQECCLSHIELSHCSVSGVCLKLMFHLLYHFRSMMMAMELLMMNKAMIPMITAIALKHKGKPPNKTRTRFERFSDWPVSFT